MAVQTGISGLTWKDGAGGNIALSIEQGIIRMLSGGAFAYRTATVPNPAQVKSGTVNYQVPEYIMSEDYGSAGASEFQVPQSGLISININTRRTVPFEYEDFDLSRLSGNGDYIIGMISNSIALSIQNDLNAHFWSFLIDKFDLTNGELRSQNITIPGLVDITSTQDDIRDMLITLQAKYIAISKTYNSTMFGVEKEELMLGLDPICDAVIRRGFGNQPNVLGERVVAKNLVGYQLGGGMYYYLDKMLGNKIDADTAYSKDTSLDTSSFVGFLFHNEAIAMPFNLNKAQVIGNPNNLNTRFIAKYQFGIGLLRPTLIYSLTTTAPASDDSSSSSTTTTTTTSSS